MNFHNKIVKTDKKVYLNTEGMERSPTNGRVTILTIMPTFLPTMCFPEAPLGYKSESKILVSNRGYHMAVRFKMILKGSIHQVLSINNDEGNERMNE